MNKLPLYILLSVSIFSFAANAQNTATSPTTPQQENIETPTSVQEITPEKKVELRKGLMKNIQNTAVNSDVLERKRLMNAIENLKKIRLRQENMGKPEKERIKYQKPRVDLKNRREFQKYMQNSYLQDLDTSEKAQELIVPKPIMVEETVTTATPKE